MDDRQPAFLIVLIETTSFRWHVAAVGGDDVGRPLLQSTPGDLDQYRGLDFDEQVSFLRHRLAGAIQRGCDRIYPRGLKAAHVLLVADGHFPGSHDGVTERLGEHFVEWMMNPPATFLLSDRPFAEEPASRFERVAGDLPADASAVIKRVLPSLISQLNQQDQWELIARPEQRNDKSEPR